MKNIFIVLIVIGNCYKSTNPAWQFHVQVLKERTFNYGVLHIDTELPSFIPIEIVKKYGKKVNCTKDF